jgi:hypothetical protein
MRAVFLVGVNHQYQVGPDGDPPVEASAEDFSKFEDFLRDVIARHGIRGVAEEMSRYALRTRQRVRGDSFPCRLAAKIRLPHRYCNPDTDMADSQREQYWIKELITFDTFPVLFILGASHVESFNGLLTEAAFQPFVIARNWEPEKPE